MKTRTSKSRMPSLVSPAILADMWKEAEEKTKEWFSYTLVLRQFDPHPVNRMRVKLKLRY